MPDTYFHAATDTVYCTVAIKIGSYPLTFLYNVLLFFCVFLFVQAYPNCDFWALSWNYRKSNLVRELMEAGADILCLQVSSNFS